MTNPERLNAHSCSRSWTHLLAMIALAIVFAFSLMSCKSAQSPKTEADSHGTETAVVDWCAEHRVPESQCTKCHPNLVAAFKAKSDWCNEHGVPESHCYACHPALKFPQEQQYLDQMKKNEVKPSSDEVDSARPSKPKLATSLYRQNALQCATDQAVIQLASTQAAERVGLTIEPVSESRAAELIAATGEVEFDPTASAAVTSLVSGTLLKWLVNVGETVTRGQALAYLESLDGAALRAEFTDTRAQQEQAEAEFERQKKLYESQLISQRDYQDAQAMLTRTQAAYDRASGALKAIGADTEGDGTLIPIRAKQSGVLAEQRVALGEVLTAGSSIGLVAERGKFWVEARVRENELGRLEIGQHATLSVDGEALGRTHGEVIWVSEAVDPATRMGRVRIRPEMNGSSLYAHQFVDVAIEAQPAETAVLVNRDAVQWEGCCNVVFVSETKDRFRPRKVRVLYINGDQYAVTGVQEGEEIVTHGSYILKTELMKEGIGAGCCGEGA